jgi:hypothetical protein
VRLDDLAVAAMSVPIKRMLNALDDEMKEVVWLARIHRLRCKDSGFSPAASEEMAINLHNAMMALIFAGAKP